MKNIDPEKSNSNQPPQIYICLVVSLSPQWLLICSKKKKIKWLTTTNPAMADHSKPQTQPWSTTVLLQQSLSKPQTQPWPTTPNPKPSHGRPLTLVLLQQSLPKPQTQLWPITHSSSPSLQHHLRWWFSSLNLPLTRISILTQSQPKHLPLSSIFWNLKELKLPSSFTANPSHHHLSTFHFTSIIPSKSSNFYSTGQANQVIFSIPLVKLCRSSPWVLLMYIQWFCVSEILDVENQNFRN